MKTSISDYDEYKNFCLEASKNDDIFKNFKQSSIYNTILEHTSIEQGHEYINFLCKLKNYNQILKKQNIFKQNDLLGNPTLFNFKDSFGEISPSTLRYVKVLCEIETLIGNLNDFKICEIGVGYGGQAKLITEYFNIKEYYLLDLNEVLELSNKYLGNKNNLYFKHLNDLIVDNYDLVISNYAFSEIKKDIQIEYVNKVIKNSKHGYFTFNFISDIFNINSLSKEEFIELIKDENKDIKIINEYPLTHPKNFILYW